MGLYQLHQAMDRQRRPVLSEKIEKRLHELRQQAAAYSKAEADRTKLNHYRKIVLAELMKEAQAKGIDTVAGQDRDARTQPRYKELIDNLHTATHIAEENLWLLRIAMRGSSLWQSEQATLRAELQAYGVKEA